MKLNVTCTTFQNLLVSDARPLLTISLLQASIDAIQQNIFTMPFHVTEATPDDISKLIDIYFAAFQDDFDLLIWPDTKSNRKWGSKGLLHDISDPDVLILKAVERVGNVDTIVSWASWELWSEEELESWTESGSESDSEWSSSSCSSESESESEEKSIEDTAESDCFYEKSWEMHRRYMKKSHWGKSELCLQYLLLLLTTKQSLISSQLPQPTNVEALHLYSWSVALKGQLSFKSKPTLKQARWLSLSMRSSGLGALVD